MIGKTLGGLLCLVVILTTPVASYAQTMTPRQTAASAAATKKMEVASERVSNLQTKAIVEIDRRLSVLNTLLPKLSAMTMVSTENKNSLIAEVTQAITDLTNLRAQVAAATDITTLKTLVKGVTDNYRVFAFMTPRINLLILADKQLVRIGSLMEIVAKSQTQLVGVDVTGTEVGGLIKALDGAQTQLIGIKTKTEKVVTDLMALTPSGYPGNKSRLQAARQTLNTNNADLGKIIGTVKANLGVFRKVVSEGSSSATLMR
jgi:hypothetical protein